MEGQWMRIGLGVACAIPLALGVIEACGGGSNSDGDAGADAALDRRGPGPVCDFPCGNPWVCIGDGYQSGRTLWCGAGDCVDASWEPARTCTSGAVCDPYGPVTPCPDGYVCNQQRQSMAPPCVLRCAPFDLSSFLPTFLAPGAPQNACTQAELDEFVASCLSNQPLKCSQFRADAATCALCTNRVWTTDDPTSLNTGGCIALVEGDASPNGCGAKQAAAAECETQACNAGCDAGDLALCIDAAMAGTCSKWEAQKCTFAEGGVENVCFSGTTFEQKIRAYVNVYCMSDGG